MAIQDTEAARAQATGTARHVTNCAAPEGHGSKRQTIKETLDHLPFAGMVWRIGLLTAAGERPYYLQPSGCLAVEEALAKTWLLRWLLCVRAAMFCVVAGCFQKHLTVSRLLCVDLQRKAFDSLYLSKLDNKEKQNTKVWRGISRLGNWS